MLTNNEPGRPASIHHPHWALTQRVAASGSLGRSRLLVKFLLYIVDRHLQDRTEEITEQQIGVRVFGRADDYDPSEDNIVRSYARNLRKRLVDYFETEGKEETLLLEIPRGGYAPAFSTRSVPAHRYQGPDALTSNQPEDCDSADAAADAAFTENQESRGVKEVLSLSTQRALAEKLSLHRRYQSCLLFCIAILVGFSCSLLQPAKLLKHLTASEAETASDAFWTQLFSADRETYIVPSDVGLVVMQGLLHERPLPLADYINDSYRADLPVDAVPGAATLLKLGKRRFTSVVDLEFATHLAQLDRVSPGRVTIRYARDLRMDDLRSGNAVLIGSLESNPWVELFQPRMNFRFTINTGSDKPSGLANTHPRPGERAIYGTPEPNHTYGLLAYVPNLTSSGHVLIVGGLNTAGTEAAATFLLTPSLMASTLRHARAPDGTLQPFELLIGAGNVATNASSPQLIAERIGPS